MKKKLGVCVLIIMTAAAANLPAYRIFMPEDPEVEDLQRLYTMAGRVFPDASYPLGKADLDEYAARLLDGGAESGSLEPAEETGSRVNGIRREVRAYRERLDFEEGRERIGYDGTLRLAGKLHGDAWPEDSSAQVAGEPIEGAAEYNGPDTAGANDFTRYPNDLHTRYVEFPDMIFLALFGGEEGRSGMHISAGVMREIHRDDVPPVNLPRSAKGDPIQIENYFIRSGYLAWKSGPFEARFGRTPVHYGAGDFSTFLPGKNLPWLDAFTYRYRIGPVTMTSYFGTLENRHSADEKELFGIGDGTDDNGYLLEEDGEFVGFNDEGVLVSGTTEELKVDDGDAQSHEMAFSETIILSSMHRFIFSWERLLLGVTAHSLVARQRNALHIGDVFPVFSWHNASVGHHNMSLVFETGYALRPGLAIYGQAAWDDVNGGDLIGIPDSEIPTIGAYLLGLRWDTPAGLSARAEAGSTHYLWGSYYAYDSRNGGYFERAIYRYRAQEGIYWMPLTSPYGPGVRWIEARGSLDLTERMSLALGGKYLSINSAADLLALDYERNDELEDAPRIESFSLWTEAAWKINLEASVLRLGMKPVLYSYDGHMWPELECAVSWSFSGRGRIGRSGVE